MTRGWRDRKLARRLLFAFVVSAVVPVVVVLSLAYWQVSDELRSQAERRLRQSSKAVGLELLDRLQQAETALERHDADAVLPTAADRITSLLAIDAQGRVRPRLGPAVPWEPLDDAQRRWLASGGTLLRSRAGSPTRIELIRRSGAPGSSEALLAAVLDTEALFDLSEQSVLPIDARICVLEGAVVLSCPDLDLPRGHIPDRGAFSFGEGDPQLAHAYPLFLRAGFQNPGWTIVLSQRRASMLAPVETFRRAFPLGGLLSVILVALFSLRRIGSWIAPLHALQDGTRRIASQDFDVRVEIDTGDELQDLAGSFNEMAERLRRQFQSLSDLIEIDRAILVSPDEPGIVEALLRGLPRICPCDAAALIAFDRGQATTRLTLARQDVGLEHREAPDAPSAEERELLQRGHTLSVDLASDERGYLEPLRAQGMTEVRLLPMNVRGDTEEVVALAWRTKPSFEADRLVYGLRLVDQATVALDSARVHEENRNLAYYDPLTDLPNRLLFQERLEQALLRGRRTSGRVAVCMLDLDGFKRINDTLGHGTGDRLLQAVARRSRQILREGALARLGGDEFTVLMTDFGDSQQVARAMERMLKLLEKPFDLQDHEVCVTASVGIAVFPEDGDEPETLLKNADVAMYHAKEVGRNNFQFFSEDMTVAAVTRMSLEQSLRQAIENDELYIEYQPIVEADGAARSVEALLRWNHPELGPIPPTEFIPIAEEAGMIVRVGAWVLQEATQQTRRWLDAGKRVSVSVNISPRQFRDAGLVRSVQTAVERSGIDHGQLTLEITEGLLMENEQWALGKLAELKRMGIQLAIDDFGTGYSSFSYLKHFPVDSLKLDRCFVRDLETSADDAAIAQAMILLGHSLGLKVVAEGVETEGQRRFLLEAGCDRLQGTLLGRPVAPDEVAL